MDNGVFTSGKYLHNCVLDPNDRVNRSDNGVLQIDSQDVLLYNVGIYLALNLSGC